MDEHELELRRCAELGALRIKQAGFAQTGELGEQRNVAVLNTVRKTERGRHRRSEQGCDGGLENERFRNGKRIVSSARHARGVRWYEVRKMGGAAHERRACGIHLPSRPFLRAPVLSGETVVDFKLHKPNTLQHIIKLEKKTTLTTDFL
jgi:hypothetical protein